MAERVVSFSCVWDDVCAVFRRPVLGRVSSGGGGLIDNFGLLDPPELPELRATDRRADCFPEATMLGEMERVAADPSVVGAESAASRSSVLGDRDMRPRMRCRASSRAAAPKLPLRLLVSSKRRPALPGLSFLVLLSSADGLVVDASTLSSWSSDDFRFI